MQIIGNSTLKTTAIFVFTADKKLSIIKRWERRYCKN